jgi:methylated-DNA-[protein]-cysteine S-methyltransferase
MILFMKFDSELVQGRFASPLGNMILAASQGGLAGVWFEGQRHFPAPASLWPEPAAHVMLDEAARQLADYFAGQRKRFDLPLDLGAGTAFQQAVWQALLQIAPGQTCSYAALSRAIGRPKAVRAVGGAIARNPFSVVVPCHRVIGSAGALTGYAGGLDRKTALLRLEGAL